GKMPNSNSISYTYTTDKYEAAKTKFIDNGYNYLLYIPPASSTDEIQLLSDKKPSATTIEAIESGLSRIAEAQRLQLAGIDTAVLAKAQKRITVKARQMTATGEKDAETYVAYAVGFLSAILVYMCL